MKKFIKIQSPSFFKKSSCFSSCFLGTNLFFLKIGFINQNFTFVKFSFHAFWNCRNCLDKISDNKFLKFQIFSLPRTQSKESLSH